MKQIFTLFLAGNLCHATNAQLLLNEVYTDPGSGNHEFFELYNPDLAPEETDNYTLVTYYKSQTQRGFYVLDMPGGTVLGKNYLVGSASNIHGAKIYSVPLFLNKGIQSNSIDLDSNVKTGHTYWEVLNDIERHAVKFIKY